MDWYFDVISPYAYLQSTRLDELQAAEPVNCVPVLFAGLLQHWENIGPAELVPKRQWTFEHVTWLAHKHRIDLKMPDHHPFNPLPLLRLAVAAGGSIAAVQRIFRFVWVDGHVPTDAAALQALCVELGVEPGALNRESVKSAVRENTTRATASGVFGVPTVTAAGRNFWGFDATDMALAHLRAAGDESIFPEQALRKAAAMPEGQTRVRPAPRPPAPDSRQPRIDYLPADLAEPAEIVDAVRRRRGGQLIELDRMLLYSPLLARGWNHLLGTVRNDFDLDPKLRELAMCVVAVVNEAEYEFFHHEPVFIEAGGTQEQAAALRNPDKALKDTALFSDTERAALGLTIDMTRTVQVHEAHFDACDKLLSRQHLIELIATIAAYNMVSRFLVALNVQPAEQH